MKSLFIKTNTKVVKIGDIAAHRDYPRDSFKVMSIGDSAVECRTIQSLEFRFNSPVSFYTKNLINIRRAI